MRRWIWTVLAVAFLAASADYGRAAECDLSMFRAKVVADTGGSILVSAQLGDKPALFVLATGAVWSVIRQRDVGDLPLRRSPVEAYGAGGTKLDHYVRVPSFKIGPNDLSNIDFMVAPDAMTADDRIDGVLGANFLNNFDLEIDLSNNIVNFFTPSGCGERAVYWPHQAVAAVPIEKDDSRHIHVMMTLDDKPVRALIDTGATQTLLTLAAADTLFALRPDSPGVEAAGAVETMDGKKLPTFRHQFHLLSLGGVQFSNPWLDLAEDRTRQHEKFGSKADALILGTHQLRQLHLYIAYKDRMLYATMSGAPTAPPGTPQTFLPPHIDPLDAQLIRSDINSIEAHMREHQPDLALQEAAQAIQRHPNGPALHYERASILAATGKKEAALPDLDQEIAISSQFAEAYLMRGTLLHELHRDSEAKADLDKAVALASSSPAGYIARGIMRRDLGDNDNAMADFAKAIELDPKLMIAYRVRAGILQREGNFAGAQAELDRAVAADGDDPAIYEIRAVLQADQHAYGKAVAELDHAVSLAPKSAVYLNDRCWYRAIGGELDKALPDCDRALELDPKYARALDSIGFIRLKQHRPSEAIAEYNAALAIEPDKATSLYGRGLAKQASGNAAGGKADLLAAQKLQADIADKFGR